MKKKFNKHQNEYLKSVEDTRKKYKIETPSFENN